MPLEKLLLILYAWSTNWANNTFVIEEVEVSNHAAVDWLEKCREECKSYIDRMPKLGGKNIYIEMDQVCITKQKHQMQLEICGSRRSSSEEMVASAVLD